MRFKWLLVALTVITSQVVGISGEREKSANFAKPKTQAKNRIGTYCALGTPILDCEPVIAEIGINSSQQAEIQALKWSQLQKLSNSLSQAFGKKDASLDKLANSAAKLKKSHLKLELQFDSKLVKQLQTNQVNRLAEICLQYRLVHEPVPLLAEDLQLRHELKLTKKQIRQLQDIDSRWISHNLGRSHVSLFSSALKILTPQQRAKLAVLRGQLMNIGAIDSSSNYGWFKMMVEHGDSNGDGVITKEETSALWSEPYLADENNDNRLSKKEISKKMKRLKEADSKYRRSILKLIATASR